MTKNKDLKDYIQKATKLAEYYEEHESLNLMNAANKSQLYRKFHLAVLGEFKRGKTSLINHILGIQSLPVDILPTTAVVYIIEYGECEKCQVVYTSGKIDEYPLEQSNLNQFSADNLQDAEAVDYIRVYINHELLKSGLTIIDTPGVNDLSESRVMVTNKILPYCDAALFLLDAAAPLTKSEADFLETKVLYNQLESIVFVVSKSDRLDDEELIESIEGASLRLKDVVGRECRVVPFSVKSDRGNRLVDAISMLNVASEADRNKRDIGKLKLSIELLIDHLELTTDICGLNESNFALMKQQYDNEVKGQLVKFQQFDLNMDQVGEETLIKMFDKSLNHFANRLKDDIRDQLLLDNNVMKYWERTMPVIIERHFRRFAEEKGEEIRRYLQNFAKHVAAEYENHFLETFDVSSYYEEGFLPKYSGIKRGKTNTSDLVKMTLPATVGALVGSFIIPGAGFLIGSACGQVIGMVGREKRNEENRDILLNQLDDVIYSIIEAYRIQAHQVIKEEFKKLKNSIHGLHESKSSTMDQMIKNYDATDEEANRLFKERILRDIEYLHQLLIEIKEVA